jgi:hypothetical protein
MATRKELEAEIEAIKNEFNANKQTNTKSDNVGESSTAGNVTRAVAQGLSFGFADEIEAVFKSIGKDKTYKEAVDEVRSKVDKFRKENPALAYGAEIAGSIPTVFAGGLGLGKVAQGGSKIAQAITKGSPVAKATKTGAISGGIYGAGSGEGVEGKAMGAVAGGALGGVLGGTVAKVLPKTTVKAKELQNKYGVRVTHGQAYSKEGNIIGNALDDLEQSSTSIIGVGSPMKEAQAIALSDFNRSAIKEALEPITGNLKPKAFDKIINRDTKGFALFDEANNLLKNYYDDALDNLELDNRQVGTILSKIQSSILSDPRVNNQAKQKALKEIQSIFKKNSGLKGMSGRDFKRLEQDLSVLSASYKQTQGGDRFLSTIISDLKSEAGKDLATITGNDSLIKANNAKVGMSIIQKAVNSANKTEGIFSTSQLLNAMKANDATIGKVATASGKGKLQDIAQLASSVLGKYTPDSGTASRLVSGNVAVNPLTALKFVPASLLSNVAYTGLTKNLTRGLLSTPRVLGEKLTPATSGLLGEQASNSFLNRGNN